MLDNLNDTMNKPTILWSMQDRANMLLYVLAIIICLLVLFGLFALVVRLLGYVTDWWKSRRKA